MHPSASDLATLSRLLDEAMDLEPQHVADWLAALPPEHTHLRPRLEQMLAAHRQSSHPDFLSDGPKLADAPDDTLARAGELIGPYRLIREIGKGGMGTVWLAERADGTLKRQIALKLPRLAWDAGLAERMARERDIGALLEHPNIARLYDAGIDQHGRPYLALEYIDGLPVDAWCQQQGLSVRDRLRLFTQVAKAIAYAHGRLVVHRDIKPSNVLVTPDGQAHLLDFGIAKLLHEKGAEETGLTQQRGRVMTPSYASPEQVAGEPITVQSDVYSLGVLLYALLTGTLPIVPKRGTLGAVEEAILEGDAPLASSRVRDRPTARALRGDIDAVIGKSLKREPRDRYATADAMAADIERHLSGEAVTARPDSAAYRLRKAVRRHWMGVSASAAVLLAVLTGAGVSTVQAHRAARAAERERVVKEFVADVFRLNVKPPTRPGELRAAPEEAFLDHSAKLVHERFAGRPDLQAELYAVVGKAFFDMSAYRLAAEYGVRRTEALGTAGADATEQAKAYLDLAESLLLDQLAEDAEQRARRALQLASGDRDLELAARVTVARAVFARGKIEAADAELAKAEAALPGRPHGGGVIAAQAMSTRARWLSTMNRRSEALPMFDAAIAKATEVEGPGSLVAARARVTAAYVLASTRDVARASSYFDAGIESVRQSGTGNQIRAALESARFAVRRYTWASQIEYAEAQVRLARARGEIAATGLPLPSELADELDMLEGLALSDWGNVQAALPLLERSAAARFRNARLPRDRFDAASALGMALMESGEHSQAHDWLLERRSARVEYGGARHPYAAFDHVKIAQNLAMMGRIQEARETLKQTPKFEAIDLEGTRNPDRYNLHVELARSELELIAGNLRRAEELFPRNLLGTNDVDGDDTGARELLGRIHCASGRAADGLRELRVVIDRESSTGYEHRPRLAFTRSAAGLCALKMGDRTAATAWARQARAAFDAQPRVSDFYKRPLIDLESRLRSGR